MSDANIMMDKGVKLNLGGKDRVLKFDLNSFAELENRYGSVDAAMKKLQEGSMKSIRYILWAGLIRDEVVLNEFGEPDHYNITPFEVAGWITPANLTKITEKLAEAFAQDMPKPTAKVPATPAMSAKKDDEVKTGVDGKQMATITPIDNSKNI